MTDTLKEGNIWRTTYNGTKVIRAFADPKKTHMTECYACKGEGQVIDLRKMVKEEAEKEEKLLQCKWERILEKLESIERKCRIIIRQQDLDEES